MIIEVRHLGKSYMTNLSQPIDISLPIKHGDDNPNCFWADPVDISTITIGDYVGSVGKGGSTNYQKISMTPHGNGTHTECYGHITSDKNATIDQCLNEFHFVAALISIPLTELDNGDYVATYDDFKKSLDNQSVDAIVIRTAPNPEVKKTQQYSGNNPPYLDPRITAYFAEHNIQHLLVDLPSVDRESDEGKLEAHKNFWQTEAEVRKNATITELIFVPDHIEDGLFLLNIQVPHIIIDAVPSKPLIYPLTVAN